MKHIQSTGFLSRLFYVVTVGLFLVTLLTINMRGTVEAAQTTNRALYMSSNVNSGTATYAISFDVPTDSIGSMEFAFCTTPLLGTTCTSPTGLTVVGVGFNGTGGLKRTVAAANISDGTGGTNVTGFSLGTDTSCVLNTSGTCNAPKCGITSGTTSVPLSTNTIASSGNNACGIRIAHSTAAQSFTGTTREVWVQFTTITNPTAVGTFYVRAATFGTTSYGTYQDGGTVAQSVQAATNVQFRVQEILQVCAGATTVDSSGGSLGTGNSCDNSGITGYLSAVNLGVADPTAVRVSPVASGGTTQGNATNGFVMVRTNATTGTTVQYRVVVDTSSYDLKVASASCAQNPSTSTADSCINSAPVTTTGGATSAIVAGTEEFGMTIPYVNRTAGSTTALSASDNYYSDGVSGGTCTVNAGATLDNNCWTWAGSTTATLGSATAPVDDEALILKFAVATGFTTPSGLYQANLDLFAVPTY